MYRIDDQRAATRTDSAGKWWTLAAAGTGVVMVLLDRRGAPGDRRHTRSLRWLVAASARASLVRGLNRILLILAIVCFVASAASFVLIRERDFVSGEGEEEPAELTVAA